MKLKTQQELTRAWPLEWGAPTVVVRCTVFNHGKFIERCLQGFLIQETTFPFEVFVHDDASTDGSVGIIRKYAEQYPLIIKPVYERENQHSKNDGSFFRTTWKPVLHGEHKYIALCEGDDYWTDPKKLQKQVEYMEGHPGCAGCFHERGTGDAEGRPIPGAELSNEIRSGDREALVPTTSYVYVGFHPNSTGGCALTFLVLRPRVSAWGMGPFIFSARGQTACRPRRFRLGGKGGRRCHHLPQNVDVIPSGLLPTCPRRWFLPRSKTSLTSSAASNESRS